MKTVGVIGYGYWGPNLVRNFIASPDARVAFIADSDPARRSKAAQAYPGVVVVSDPKNIFQDSTVDAVIIATPVSTHFPLAMEALTCGKHVWLEKPLAATTEEAERLVEEADKRGLQLHVDHTFAYTGPVRKLKELYDAKTIGDLYYYDSTRISLGLFQYDVDVLWDLAVHDLAILYYLLPFRPIYVSAHGIAHFPGRRHNTAFLTLYYPQNFIAHINASWLSPVKVRNLILAGSAKMAVYNDMEPTEKLRIYDTGIDLPAKGEETYFLQLDYRTGDMWAPKCSSREALALEVEQFLFSITHNVPTVTDGKVGLETVRVLEAATRSMNLKGAMQEI
jgi:predicted dehydrogenase